MGTPANLFFVRITADLEVDAPKVLKSHAQRDGADFQNWAFLTGIEPELGEIPVAFLDTFKDGVSCAMCLRVRSSFVLLVNRTRAFDEENRET